eukprot:TRINITY_DN350_c1_g2_i2.p1 TRINITY_DN350_c1_g2~~TRINITY_DN350_c1_g2_i2.p1  ORF type:complete len:331 (-),score=159.09 TRINITY_DN350_c1_g2_i2:21-1013(-)
MSPKTSTFVLLALASLVALVAANTEPIIDAKEYQLGLDESDFGPGTVNRFNAINEYMTAIRNQLDLDDFDTRFTIEADLRREGTYDIDNCNPLDSTTLRFRSWFEGSNEGTNTVDVKQAPEGQSRSDAISQPLAPSATYLSQSAQDIEEDVHPCYRDWSRTTKINFSTLPTINTCADVRALFPGIVDEDEDSRSVSSDSDLADTTYLYTVSGTMPSGSFLFFSFNLEYDSAQDARTASNIKSGEFSFTYSATGGGFDGFDASELRAIENLYTVLLDEFGSPGSEDEGCSSNNNDNNNSPSSNNNSNSNNDSSDAIMAIPSLLVVLLAFLF